jgi:hypothetical protein
MTGIHSLVSHFADDSATCVGRNCPNRVHRPIDIAVLNTNDAMQEFKVWDHAKPDLFLLLLRTINT